MGQKDVEKWTAAANLQPTISESDRLLDAGRAGWPIAEAAGPDVGDVTADLKYLRLHGAKELYEGGCSDTPIELWAARIHALAAGGDAEMPRFSSASKKPTVERNVFCVFDNTMKVHATDNALRLARALGIDAQLDTAAD